MAEDFSNRLNNIEQKWQQKWDEEELFEVDPTDEDKFYITVAYPYPSGGMHIGHVRTYALPDIHICTFQTDARPQRSFPNGMARNRNSYYRCLKPSERWGKTNNGMF